MDLRLHASEDLANLRAGAADAAVRYGRGEHPGLRSGTGEHELIGVHAIT